MVFRVVFVCSMSDNGRVVFSCGIEDLLEIFVLVGAITFLWGDSIIPVADLGFKVGPICLGRRNSNLPSVDAHITTNTKHPARASLNSTEPVLGIISTDVFIMVMTSTAAVVHIRIGSIDFIHLPVARYGGDGQLPRTLNAVASLILAYKNTEQINESKARYRWSPACMAGDPILPQLFEKIT